MCGISGVLRLSNRVPVERLTDIARCMEEAQVHRGPDDSGIWLSPDRRCALSHRRLSIIDLDRRSRQPMSLGPDGALTFNGEIYNFQELRAELERKGEAFFSQSDTEVLLRGFAREGLSWLDRLDGMFAFGAYDAASGRLTLARDRFGEKPLYYCRTQDLFAFSSELHALTLLPDFDPTIPIERISDFLAFQYVPAPNTIYRSCKKLEPGHSLALETDGSIAIRRYFEFRTSPTASATADSAELAENLEEILVGTIRTRMIADVPLGAFLSGGVDSSTVVALAQKRLNRTVKTFSIGFADSDESEHLEAEAMARHIGSEHSCEIVDDDFVTLGEHIAKVLDEPNADSSCLPTYMLSRMTRRHVTVALSGDGGDEMFGGYGRYVATLEDRDRDTEGAWDPGRAYFYDRILYFPDHVVERLIKPMPDETARYLGGLRKRLREDGRPLGNALRQIDAETYLPGAVLAKVDRMSMQHSLEVRAPLLGNAVARFAARLGEADCFESGAGKKVLRTVAKNYLPAEWIDRPKKGFGMPMGGWGARRMLNEFSRIVHRGDSRLRDWFGDEMLSSYLAHQKTVPALYQLWTLFILEHWLRHHPATVG
jgi:asparagine synthase (glutamine-hydrolysing)